MKAAKKKRRKKKLELARRNVKFEKISVITAIIMITTKIDLHKESISI